MWERLARWLGSKPWFGPIARRTMPPIDRLLHRLSDGRVHLTESFMPTLILTTTGRRSGLPRAMPLAYVRHEGAWIITGTNYGGESHPGWSWNLLDDPHATVEVHGETIPVTARLLAADERARVWPDLVRMWPAYDDYIQRSGRDMRVFALHPRQP